MDPTDTVPDDRWFIDLDNVGTVQPCSGMKRCEGPQKQSEIRSTGLESQ